MMFELILSPGAEKMFARLLKSDRKLFKQLSAAMDKLSNSPHTGKALTGNLKGFYSHRVRDYRILYEIEGSSRIVVLKVEHRKQVYR
jgi:mRNA interferase RelE/StbE